MNFDLIEKKSFDKDNHQATVKLLNDNSLNSLLKVLMENDIELKQVNEVIPTMSEIFIEVVGNNS